MFTNLVSLESLLNPLLDNAEISFFSKVDKMYQFCCIGSQMIESHILHARTEL